MKKHWLVRSYGISIMAKLFVRNVIKIMDNSNNQKPNFFQLYQKIGSIDGKLDGVLNHLEKINGRLDSHSKKIDTLEDTTNQIIGKASILGAIAGFVGALILTLIGFFKR